MWHRSSLGGLYGQSPLADIPCAVRTLLDYLAAGDTPVEFLDHFPTVSSERAVVVLEQSNDLLVTLAHSA